MRTIVDSVCEPADAAGVDPAILLAGPPAPSRRRWRGALLHGDAEISALRDDWERVWAADPRADLFSSFTWVDNLFSHFGQAPSETSLAFHDGVTTRPIAGGAWTRFVCAVRDDAGMLVAVLPLVRVDGSFQRGSHALLSTPVNFHSPRSGLAATQFDADVADAMVRAFGSLKAWSVLLLGGLPAACRRSRLLADALVRAGMPCVVDSAFPGAYLRFDAGVSASADVHFDGPEHAHFRRSLVKARNGLAKAGAIEVDCLRGPRAWPEGFERFVAVDAKSWKANTGENIGRSPALLAYYGDLCRRLAALDRLEVWLLRVAGVDAAAFVCPHDGRARYTLKSSYDEAFGASRSPSLVLLHDMVRRCWGDAGAGMDFVGKVAFLDRWANEDLAFHTVACYRTRYARWQAGAVRRVRAWAGDARRRLPAWVARPVGSASRRAAG